VFPTPIYNFGVLRPSVTPTAKRLKVRRNRRVIVKVACESVGTPVQTTCGGTVGLFAKIDGGRQRRIARARISVTRDTTRKVALRLNARAIRVLNRKGKLKARLRARTDGGVSAKQVTLRR